MPHTLKWEEKGFLVKFTGLLTIEELTAFNEFLYGHEFFDKLKYQIVDFTEVTEFRLTIYDIELLAALDSASSAWSRKQAVAVITNDDLVIKFVNIYSENLADTEWEADNFPDEKSARDWINKVFDDKF